MDLQDIETRLEAADNPFVFFPVSDIRALIDEVLRLQAVEAGWRPPARVITTVEELEALPNNEERAIPQEAVEAAARVMKPRQFEPNYTPLGMWSDLEQMHEIAELDRDMTRDRVRDILTAAYPSIEKQIRAEVAAEMKRRDNDYLKFANRFGGYYMGLQSAFHEAAQIAEGANHA